MERFFKILRTKKTELVIVIFGILLILFIFPQSRNFIIWNFQFYIIDSFHSKQDAQFFFERGVSYSEKNNFSLASRTFQKNIQQFNPTNPYQKESLYNLGVLYYQEGQKIYPKNKKKGMLYFQKANFFWSQFLHFYPNDSKKQNNILTARVYIDSLDETPINQMAKYYKDQGQKAYYNHDYDTAIKFYKKAIKADPTYDTAYNNIGSVYFFQKNYEEAVKYWEQAILLNPKENEDLYLTMGSVYGQYLHNPERAIYFLKKHLELHPNDKQKDAIKQNIQYLEHLTGLTNE